MRKSTKTKPRKPHPAFPLFAHNNGQWCRKIKGKFHFFGVWADPQAALEKWNAEKDDRLAGRVPRATSEHRPDEATTLGGLCNRFMNTKRIMMERKELSVHSWRDYFRVCESLVTAFGRDRLLTDILPDDFERLGATWGTKVGPVRLGNEINRVRVVFNYAYKNGLIDRPMRYGEGFKRPSRKTLRLARAEKGPKMFEAAELQRILKGAGQPLRAMLLLGINAGLGNNDVGTLPMKALDLAGGWLTFPRPKTGIERRCPLWPETLNALREWLKVRPAPNDETHAALVFTTSKGGSWAKETSDNPVSKETRKLLDELGISGGRNFYAIRHTFETIAGESRDQVAVDSIMGHADESMAGHYRERISDERLKAVTDFVRTWLIDKAAKKKEDQPRLKIALQDDESAIA